MTEQNQQSRPNVALILEALEYQEEHSLEGPLFPEAQEELRRLVEQLEASQRSVVAIGNAFIDWYQAEVFGDEAEAREEWQRLAVAGISNPAKEPSGEQTREQLLERLALTVKEAVWSDSFDGTLFESQVSGTLWLLYGERSPASEPEGGE